MSLTTALHAMRRRTLHDPGSGTVAYEQHDPRGQFAPLRGRHDGLEIRTVAAGKYRKTLHDAIGSQRLRGR